MMPLLDEHGKFLSPKSILGQQSLGDLRQTPSQVWEMIEVSPSKSVMELSTELERPLPTTGCGLSTWADCTT